MIPPFAAVASSRNLGRAFLRDSVFSTGSCQILNVTPFLRIKPFAVPGAPPPPQGVAGHVSPSYVSPSSPVGDIEMVDMSPQARAGPNFQMEHLDSSPGSTLRTRSRNVNRDDLDESIDILTESPGNKNRRRNVTKESQEVRNPRGSASTVTDLILSQ